jgi:uncharacterized protein YybS (DUF2232 family)
LCIACISMLLGYTIYKQHGQRHNLLLPHMYTHMCFFFVFFCFCVQVSLQGYCNPAIACALHLDIGYVSSAYLVMFLSFPGCCCCWLDLLIAYQS